MTLKWALGLLASTVWAQLAIIPTSQVCPDGQIQIATSIGTIGNYTSLSLGNCAVLGVAVTLDKTSTPWVFQPPPPTTPPTIINMTGCGTETPQGSGTTYTLAAMPNPSIPLVFVNNTLTRAWTFVGKVLTFTNAPSGPVQVFYLCLGP